MNINLTKIARPMKKVSIKLKKHSPEILVITGIVGTVASAVMACKATTKLNPIIEDMRTDLDTIHTVAEKRSDKYTEKDIRKATAMTYGQTTLKIVKLYGSSVVIGALSIASILEGHNILRKRNIAIAAAYATIDKGFKEYRNRVVERFGEEVDRELKYNMKSEVLEEVKTNKKGQEKVVTKTVQTANVDECSDYARFFDEACSGWTKDPEFNLMFIRRQQDYANECLHRNGYLFLNDVYKMLGIPVTKAGQIVGWVYDPDKETPGDDFVDFHIYDVNNERKRAFVNGYEKSILLDFNVHGNILDLI